MNLGGASWLVDERASIGFVPRHQEGTAIRQDRGDSHGNDPALSCLACKPP
jgi:hypothetical protein